MTTRPYLSSLAATVFAATVFAPAAEAAQSWTMLPDASELVFTVNPENNPLEGRFEDFDAEIVFSPDDLESSKIAVTVDMTSVTTAAAQQTEQTRSQMWLDVSNHTQARYETLSINALGDDRYAIDASLTIKGVSREIAHEAVIRVDGDEASAEGEITLVRTNFNVGMGMFESGEQVALEVIVRFAVAATGD